jgi:CBS domain containing-hemolysin-like protein
MEALSLNVLVWAGIVFCISQSAMFSGLNLALLGISRLRLEVEASAGNPAAVKILSLRKNFNFLLTTILWGNVAINVLLTLLSESVMAGVSAFFFFPIPYHVCR